MKPMEDCNTQVTVGIEEYDNLRDRSKQLSEIEKGKRVIRYYRVSENHKYPLQERIEIFSPAESDIVIKDKLEEKIEEQRRQIDTLYNLYKEYQNKYWDLKEERKDSWVTSSLGIAIIVILSLTALAGWAQVSKLIDLIPK